MEEIPREFTVFPQLAQEIRLEIWRKAIELNNEPRIFEIGKTNDVCESETPTLSNVNIAKWSCPTTPTILHVCRESREYALKRYHVLKFRNRTIFIDFDFDWIFFPQSNDLEPREESDERWWVWRTALANDGYWPLIKNIAIPACVWCNLLAPLLLEDNSLRFEWPEKLEGMPGLTQVAMVFEVWAQWEDGYRARFATKGPIEFGRFEDFCVSGLGGKLPIQWVEYAKHTLDGITKFGLPWKIPEVMFASVKRGGKEPVMHGVMLEWYRRRETDIRPEGNFEMIEMEVN